MGAIIVTPSSTVCVMILNWNLHTCRDMTPNASRFPPKDGFLNFSDRNSTHKKVGMMIVERWWWWCWLMMISLFQPVEIVSCLQVSAGEISRETRSSVWYEASLAITAIFRSEIIRHLDTGEGRDEIVNFLLNELQLEPFTFVTGKLRIISVITLTHKQIYLHRWLNLPWLDNMSSPVSSGSRWIVIIWVSRILVLDQSVQSTDRTLLSLVTTQPSLQR